MTQIKIGADELILWLRKNGKASEISNEVLGEKIRKLIEDELIGRKLEVLPCFWYNKAVDEFAGKFKLPEHATQYEIDVIKLPELFNELNRW